MKANQYTNIYTVLKWIFSILSFLFFYQSISEFDWDSHFIPLFKSAFEYYPLGFISVFLMVILNWNFEAMKFKILLKSKSLSRIRLFFTVLGGTAISNFTPARSGEYIGRSLLLKGVHPIRVTIATVAGNLAQVLMTYGLGLLSILVVYIFFDFYDNWADQTSYIIAVILCFLLLLFLFLSKRIIEFLSKILPSKITSFFKLVKHYNFSVYGRVVVLSFLRYCVFSAQLFILLQLFSDFSLPFNLVWLVPVAFLLQSIVPIPAISDIGVRVGVCGLLFGDYISNIALVQSVTCLWAINLILPGVIGAFFLWVSNFIKE
ncbi:MAG: lysylphosphatidylglycerol synthase domain-containing protein [Bacteroidia bacterium]|nr:lysylphosphatidylglycerol synthase domain-containing protein [Bacteroidia bacterium]